MLDEEVGGEVVGKGTRVLVVASEVDEAFCAGADLKERRGMGGEEYVYCVSIRVSCFGFLCCRNRWERLCVGCIG